MVLLRWLLLHSKRIVCSPLLISLRLWLRAGFCPRVGDQVFHQMLGQLKHLPFLVLAARICPDHVEATLFATIMSISNVGGDVAHFWGAALLDWLGAFLFCTPLRLALIDFAEFCTS